MKERLVDERKGWAIVQNDGTFEADRSGVLVWNRKKDAEGCVEDGARLARVLVVVAEVQPK